MSATFDSLTLRKVVLELQATLLGSQVQKIRQSDEHTVVVRLHGGGVSRWLLFCTHPQSFRAHLTTRTFETPQEPPTFCMALRKYLEGGRVMAVTQDGADRVMRLDISSSWGQVQLVAELMGRHSNLVLLSGDGHVIEAIKHVSPRLSHRVILPGRAYPPLPASDKPSLWDAPASVLSAVWESAPEPLTREWLVGSFGGMSGPLADQVLAAPDPRSALNAVIASAAPEAGVSERLDREYASSTSVSNRDALVKRALSVLAKEAAVLRRRSADTDKIEQRAEHMEEWRIAGELLSANPHLSEKGASTVSLPNYYAEEMAPLDIPLDPALSPRENAEAYFTRFRKAKSALDRLPELRREIDEQMAEIARRRESIESADEAGLAALLLEWSPGSRTTESHSPKAVSEYPPGVRIKRVTSDEGWPIWIGENATGNDYLTTRLSDPSDIWLHVRAAASAHGVIRTAKHPEKVPQATLRRAAELVAAKSEAKGSSVIPVDYTLRRYVRKPRGAAPGRVTYTNEKTIDVGPA